MKITTNNCLECPFHVITINLDQIVEETSSKCNLLYFLKIHKSFTRFYNYDKFIKMKKIEPLKNCPLKQNKINVEYE